MIRLVDITENLPDNNLFLAKIKANFSCYEKYDFCNTFLQKDESENTTAYINILSSNATVYICDNADKREIKDFLMFYKVKNIFCNKAIFSKEQGVVLKFNRQNSLNLSNGFDLQNHPDYQAVYSLLKFEFSLPDYNEFVSDLSYRINRGAARLIPCKNGVIFTLWETENSAVISALAVKKSERGKSLGSKLLKSMIAQIVEKDVYIYCEKGIEEFYIKNGFIPTEEYFTGELNYNE